MKELLNKLISAFSPGTTNRTSPDESDVVKIMAAIRDTEQSLKAEPGRRIHQFTHAEYHLRLDYDITRTYRLTVHRGGERIYSFSVFCDSGAYDKLEEAYERIIGFLNSNQDLQELPDDDLLKGFYFGG